MIDVPDTFFQYGAHKEYSDVGVLVNRLLPNIIAFAGIIFFLLILGGGFMMIRSAGGGGNQQDAAKAKAAVTFAVTGFLLVVFAYFILQIVGKIIGVDFTATYVF